MESKRKSKYRPKTPLPAGMPEVLSRCEFVAGQFGLDSMYVAEIAGNLTSSGRLEQLDAFDAQDLALFLLVTLLRGRSETGFGGPFGQTLAALMTNIDPFTGRQIANPADSYTKQLTDGLLYAWKMAAPSWLTGTGALWKSKEALEGRVKPRTGEPDTSLSQAASRMFGVNVESFDPRQTRAQNIAGMSREIGSVQRRLGQLLGDKNLKPQERTEIRDQYVSRQRKLAEELRKYAKETEKAPRVRRTAQ